MNVLVVLERKKEGKNEVVRNREIKWSCEVLIQMLTTPHTDLLTFDTFTALSGYCNSFIAAIYVIIPDSASHYNNT
jgi:hypothetical protein